MSNKLGSYGLCSLLICLMCAKAFISAPMLYVKHSASAGWLEVLLSGAFEFLVLAVVLKLMSNFGMVDIIDICNQRFGGAVKAIAGVLSVIVFLFSSAAVFRCFCEMVRNSLIKNLSYDIVAIFILAAVSFAAYLGVHTQASVVGLILPAVGVGVFIILLINSTGYSVSNIQPVAGCGVNELLKNALLKNSTYFELGAVLFLTPYFRDKSSVKRVGFTALFVSVFLTSIITLCYQLAVPYEAAATFSIPYYQMTRMIKANFFLQRFEPLNMFVWAGVFFVYIAFGIWLSAHVFKKTFSLSADYPLVFIFSLIVAISALIPGAETNVEKIYDFKLTYGYIAYPLLPLGILIAASTKRKISRK